MTNVHRLAPAFLCFNLPHHLVLFFHFLLVLASSNSIPPPITGLSKGDLCALDVDRSSYVLDLVNVTPEQLLMRQPSTSKIFCFVNTISVHHKTRAQSVADTWGQRCDKLMFFSNTSDTIVVGANTQHERRYDVIKMNVIADHNHLWQKHKATLRYVYTHFRHDYDWFYKADDDAYVIINNLRHYLLRPEIMQSYKQEPMQIGHRFNLTQDLVSYYIVNETLEATWRSKWDRWIFNSGGPGYAMNRLYLDKIVSTLSDWTCLSDRYSAMLPDDVSISFCMMWHNVFPWDTRDHQGRERWHADKPRGVYFVNPNRPNYWYVQYHEHIGGVRPNQDSAAPDSVAFHYISPPLMYHLERTLYLCREGDDVNDVAAFNDKYGLAISNNIMVYQDVPQDKIR
ncbi:glycoprotein-n-acetylgalactosamine 3-beta [Plasmopara halstedii]|uniref:N-acetylgalactosaminide beta-1,3-galactosyltransferase n=1 Tax=Plasmopara halstedii TaxID=4781 RepID=A0A0P1A9U4_PLAHL|nr:glycoprotein-n-acetylgalactosamine 3-beta [Plasmopara halstedii]CEG37303.1 glycoprotein-n-acetylgalactosamine 3-beta [Plasmopara halstedii]|eukprot:XP_024573672.1 glycoprotein-n-acetylgalactosamine 3-beta [Plasmopara halstedii]